MNRVGVFVICALAVCGCAKTDPNKFDLACNVTVTQYFDGRASPPAKESTRYSIDLEAGGWCEERDCSSGIVSTIARVRPSELWLTETPDVLFTIDRSNGELVYSSQGVPLSVAKFGRCERATFTGWTQKF